MNAVADKYLNGVRRSWNGSPALTSVACIMSLALAGAVIGLVIDCRVITGVPAWIKPAKFALSTAIYSGTLAWIFAFVDVWRRFRKILAGILSAVLFIEIGIIFIQAARGTTSHFNVGTTLNALLYTVMGISIGLLFLASIGVLVILFRQHFTNRALGWALRLGVLITVLGSGIGGLMTRPSSDQQRMMAARERPKVVGAHTVGAPDGGPGIPILGWSTEHGDLRVPHFFGLHGMQVIPLLYFFARWRRRNHQLTGFVFASAAGYLAFIGILAWQALRGESPLAPGTEVLYAELACGALLSISVIWTLRRPIEKPELRTAVVL